MMSTLKCKSALKDAWPRRIVCITAETTEIVFALGAGDRVAGVSGYSIRPEKARKKPKVAAFTSIRMDKIRELNPDLIFGFSDLQKDIARELVAEGFNVFISNQRSLEEIGDAILAIGRLIGLEKKAVRLRNSFFLEIKNLEKRNSKGRKPKVYFEEWDEPMISGIRWVSELIERLGGKDIFSELKFKKKARDRFVSSEDVIARNPDIVIASWCGKKARLEKIAGRTGWDRVSAVQKGHVYEIKSPDVLAPGLSLLHGAREMARIFKRFKSENPEKRP